LSELEDVGLIFPWYAQNLHDDAQRIEEGDIAREVALRPDIQHELDEFPRDFSDIVGDALESFRGESRKGDGPQRPMLGAINGDQHPENVALATRKGARHSYRVLCEQIVRSVAVMKQIGLTLDGENVGVLARDQNGS